MKSFDKYYAGKINTVLSSLGAGYAVLRVCDEGILRDYKKFSQEKILQLQTALRSYRRS
jgi:hypothetical protein